jgi:hypothetical protein
MALITIDRARRRTEVEMSCDARCVETVTVCSIADEVFTENEILSVRAKSRN